MNCESTCQFVFLDNLFLSLAVGKSGRGFLLILLNAFRIWNIIHTVLSTDLGSQSVVEMVTVASDLLADVAFMQFAFEFHRSFYNMVI